MTVFGWDASDYDWPRGPMDLGSAYADEVRLFTHKSSEGTSTTHQQFGEAMRRARAAGIPVLGAYHVVRSPRNAAAEVDFCLRVVDAAAPWWRQHPTWIWQVDLERWPYDAVPPAEGEDFADIIEARTGRRAVIYASRGQYGDTLRGTSHDLWNAAYGTNPATELRNAYPGDASSRWAPYSGRTPALLQFGSRTTIGRQPGCDANAWRGSLADLITWARWPQPIVENDMADSDEILRRISAIEEVLARVERVTTADATAVAPPGFYPAGQWVAHVGASIPLSGLPGQQFADKVPAPSRVLLDRIDRLEGTLAATRTPPLTADQLAAIGSAAATVVGAQVTDMEEQIGGLRREVDRLVAALGTAGAQQAELLTS